MSKKRNRGTSRRAGLQAERTGSAEALRWEETLEAAESSGVVGGRGRGRRRGGWGRSTQATALCNASCVSPTTTNLLLTA